MLVDSSIVVLESIETARARGEAEPEIAGTRQIALPVVAGFLTTSVVFLPLVYLQGLARAFFGAQAFAIVASLAASLLFSLTVTPVLARSRRTGAARGWTPGRAAYLRLLDAGLARPALPVLAAGAATAVALLAVALLPHELVPDAPTRDLVVRYRLDPDLAPDAARRVGTEVEARTAAALAGQRAERFAWQSPERAAQDDAGETGRIELRFPDPASAARARRRLRVALTLPDVEVWVEPRPSAFLQSIERTGRRLEVVASAATPERAAALARRVEDRLRGAAGMREAHLRRDQARTALLLAWDVPRLAALGADRDRLEEQVREALGDQTTGRVRIDGVDPGIVVLPTEQDDPALLPVVPAVTKTGAKADGPGAVPLGALARLTPGVRPAALEREDGLPAVRLAFDGGRGHRGNRANRDPLELLRGVARAADEQVAPGGQALELGRAFGQLRLALSLSLLLVFLTVAALYESLRTPLVVMTTVPVALGGALGLLALAGQTLNVFSFLGLILLAGIVVNNAIVLVHRIEDHLRAGEALDQAVRLAGAERYRPILMTTLATVAGMLPLALLGGEGVELRRALALAVIGGMSLSTFASLLLVPVLYRWSHRAR
jgi:HAE1 family hydrophobic/amphiphilic exporter-1